MPKFLTGASIAVSVLALDKLIDVIADGLAFAAIFLLSHTSAVGWAIALGGAYLLTTERSG